MRKLTILLLAAFTLFAFSACDNSTEEPKDQVTQLSTTELQVPAWANGTYNGSLGDMNLTLEIDEGMFSINVPIPMIGEINNDSITQPYTKQTEITKADGTRQYILTAKIDIFGPGTATEDSILTVTQVNEQTLDVTLSGLLTDPLRFTKSPSETV